MNASTVPLNVALQSVSVTVLQFLHRMELVMSCMLKFLLVRKLFVSVQCVFFNLSEYALRNEFLLAFSFLLKVSLTSCHLL